MSATVRAQPFHRRSSLRLPALFFALALGALALGCEDDKPNPLTDAGTITGAADAPADTSMSACPVSTGPIVPGATIDNFENGSSALPSIAGRMGSWYAEGDATAAAIIQPAGLASPELIPGGRCGSQHALRVTGTGFLDWGSEVSVPLNYGMDDAGVSGYRPYNGSQYQGVTFFARIGDTSAKSVWFGMSDQYARPEAGICTIGGGVGSGCYDAFGSDLSSFIGTEWQQFRIPFAEMSQRNFGVPSTTVDTSKLYDIEFVFAPNTVFDLWVDDISFY